MHRTDLERVVDMTAAHEMLETRAPPSWSRPWLGRLYPRDMDRGGLADSAEKEATSNGSLPSCGLTQGEQVTKTETDAHSSG